MNRETAAGPTYPYTHFETVEGRRVGEVDEAWLQRQSGHYGMQTSDRLQVMTTMPWVCTRPDGHTGVHIAHQHTGLVKDIWLCYPLEAAVNNGL